MARFASGPVDFAAGTAMSYNNSAFSLFETISSSSTAGDLASWNAALHGGKLLSAAAYHELITPDTLNDGTRLRYANGLAVDSELGRRLVHHGGDMPGFATELAYFPDEALTIVVLVNTEGPVRPDTHGTWQPGDAHAARARRPLERGTRFVFIRSAGRIVSLRPDRVYGSPLPRRTHDEPIRPGTPRTGIHDFSD